MKVLGIVFAGILAIALLIGLSVALDLGGIFYQEKTAGIRGHSQAERQIESGSSRIQRYEEFFNLCSGIQAKETAIDALNANASMPRGRREAAITANQTARGQLIASYDAKASEAYTAARFKSAKLPYRIPRDLYTGKNATSCGN